MFLVVMCLIPGRRSAHRKEKTITLAERHIWIYMHMWFLEHCHLLALLPYLHALPSTLPILCNPPRLLRFLVIQLACYLNILSCSPQWGPRKVPKANERRGFLNYPIPLLFPSAQMKLPQQSCPFCCYARVQHADDYCLFVGELC